jgi:hypothetical protein
VSQLRDFLCFTAMILAFGALMIVGMAMEGTLP